ncbi:MAG: DsbA family oxidoreductase [Myxococcota bacterium]
MTPRPTASPVRIRLTVATLALWALSACAAPAAEPTAAAPTAAAAAPTEPAAPSPAQATAATPEPAVPATTAPLIVDIYHDTICPWCRIGHERLAKALQAFDGPPVLVRYHPFQLDSSVPAEGVDMRQRLAAKYGADRVDGMFDRVTQIGAADGITFRFDAVRISPNTALSHALIEATPEISRGQVLGAIHKAYFEAGRDIGSAAVLADIYSEAGLPREDAVAALANVALVDKVRGQADAAARMGFGGVPHFVVHGGDATAPPPTSGGVSLHGAQPTEAIVAALRQVSAGR